MITREAYECCVGLIRPRLKAAGIWHMRRLTLEEFRKYIKVNGWPVNNKYQEPRRYRDEKPGSLHTNCCGQPKPAQIIQVHPKLAASC